ncbi:hypothetical protein ZWY2020_013189 [Hordeum vulgare]|nr:hypothetical protein ZWY2020_013189 [Hordeum vulgare]
MSDCNPPRPAPLAQNLRRHRGIQKPPTGAWGPRSAGPARQGDGRIYPRARAETPQPSSPRRIETGEAPSGRVDYSPQSLSRDRTLALALAPPSRLVSPPHTHTQPPPSSPRSSSRDWRVRSRVSPPPDPAPRRRLPGRASDRVREGCPLAAAGFPLFPSRRRRRHDEHQLDLSAAPPLASGFILNAGHESAHEVEI